MILAAAACAEGDGPPPPELELGWQARRWRVLPEPGGLRDQCAGELRRMIAALNVYDAIKGWRGSANWVRWRDECPEQWEIVASVLQMRED